MIIECACKKYKFAVKAEEIGINGRVVQCGVGERCDPVAHARQHHPKITGFRSRLRASG